MNKQQLEQLYLDAYGQTQSTPDGPMCRLGRIERTQRIVDANKGDHRYVEALETLQMQAKASFDAYDKALMDYGKPIDFQHTCQCPFCQKNVTLHLGFRFSGNTLRKDDIQIQFHDDKALILVKGTPVKSVKTMEEIEQWLEQRHGKRTSAEQQQSSAALV